MRFLRSLLLIFFFTLFGFGGLLLSYLILPFVWKRHIALKIVRFLWWISVKCYILTGMIKIDHKALRKDIRGAIILANHPSLIDVVLLTMLIPRTFSVAKHALRRNPFVGMVVRRVFLPDDAKLMDEAPQLLAKGYNILIFPEGTRSPHPKRMHKWHRGGVQLSLRTHAPIQPLVIDYSYQFLAKGQSLFDCGTKTVQIHCASLPQVAAIQVDETTNYHSLAVRLTHQLSAAIQAKLETKEC